MGCMQEYSAVSIDRFDADNLKSTVYFLSHKHAGMGDNMYENPNLA